MMLEKGIMIQSEGLYVTTMAISEEIWTMVKIIGSQKIADITLECIKKKANLFQG